MIPPETEIVFDNILIKQKAKSKDTMVYFRVPLEKAEERSQIEFNCYNSLANFLQVYAIITDFHAKENGQVSQIISSENPFGSIEDSGLTGIITLKQTEKQKADQRQREVTLLKHAIDKYKTIEPILRTKKKWFLRNAIDYYYRALGGREYVEQDFIDLMIAFEYLFSDSTGESKLRYSLRAGFLLSVDIEEKRAEIVENIKDLYGKRSNIVHGNANVDLTYIDVEILRQYVKKAIKLFLYFDMTKEDILKLIDESVYNVKKYQELMLAFYQATSKW